MVPWTELNTAVAHMAWACQPHARVDCLVM